MSGETQENIRYWDVYLKNGEQLSKVEVIDLVRPNFGSNFFAGVLVRLSNGTEKVVNYSEVERALPT
jgi:hypothetical protein